MSDSENLQPGTASAGKGQRFFDRADEVAETGNWDFAIEMYLEGIRREPGNLDRGHNPLRQVALNRKAQGGKGPGMRDKLKRRPTKDPVESLANASFLLAKEPGSVELMLAFLKAAAVLGLNDVIKWICDILLESQRIAKKPSKRVLTVIIGAYRDLEEYALAMEACDRARRLDPNDGALSHALSELSAKHTIKQGKYDQEGDFTRAVKDMDYQKELAQEDALVKDEKYLTTQVEKARAEYVQSPAVPGKINAYVDALLKFEDDTHEAQAIETLTEAHKATGAYQFKMRVGDVKIRQMTRKWRQLKQAGDDQGAAEQARMQLNFELEEFRERTVNYPTDLTIRYELGRRQYLARQYDDAIVSLQQAQHDPRRRLRAMTYLGMAFRDKGWLREAAETLASAAEGDVPEARLKELRYCLGDVLERMGDVEQAQQEFSAVALLDYQFKDVRQRIEKLRKQQDSDA